MVETELQFESEERKKEDRGKGGPGGVYKGRDRERRKMSLKCYHHPPQVSHEKARSPSRFFCSIWVEYVNCNI